MIPNSPLHSFDLESVTHVPIKCEVYVMVSLVYTKILYQPFPLNSSISTSSINVRYLPSINIFYFMQPILALSSSNKLLLPLVKILKYLLKYI